MNWQNLSSPVKRKKRSHRLRRRGRIRAFIVFCILFLALTSYLTNPFTRYSIVRDPYDAHLQGGQFVIEENRDLRLRQGTWYRRFAWAKSGWHIVNNVFSRGKKAPEGELEEIIASILYRRFDPERPFLISGDHFSMLYLRSLGIFYHSTLDPRTALNEQDWHDRQALYLKTTAYALDAFSTADAATTTIVPVGTWSVALINVFSPPSDSMYSLFHSLEVMQNSQYFFQTYPFAATTSAQLQTKQVAQKLQSDNTETLQRLLKQYREHVFDSSTGLVRQDIEISSTRDGIKRESAFYDNVIYWRTLQLAEKLGLTELSDGELAALKERILTTFWVAEPGFFLDELSDEAQKEKYYSSDWLIAYSTGFLDPENPKDRPYLEKAIAFAQAEKLDQPFGMRFTNQQPNGKLHLFVRWSAPEYVTKTIWSHWGMEYTKLLSNLYQTTCEKPYIERAQQQVTAYENNILRYRGYPEVYDKDGDMFVRWPFYRSVWQTGWVVNFLEARKMVEWSEDQACQNS